MKVNVSSFLGRTLGKVATAGRSKTLRRLTACTAAAALSTSLAAGTASADTIDFGGSTVTATAGDSSFSTNGTFLRGWNGGATTVDVDGVGTDFGDFAATSFGDTYAGATGSNDLGLTGGFQTVLDEFTWDSDDTDDDLNLGAFTDGNMYEVQVFFVDERANAAYDDRYHNVSGGGTLSGDIDAGNDNALGGDHAGSYVIATWTSDGTTVDLNFDSFLGDGTAIESHLTAVQVRDLGPAPAVPEPSSLALLGLAGLGLAVRRNKRS